MDGLWSLILFTGFIYVGGFMRSLIARAILVILGGTMVVMALITIFSPEVGSLILLNFIYLPIPIIRFNSLKMGIIILSINAI